MEKNSYLDPNWRIRNFYSIVDKHEQQVIFSPNEIQDRINQSKSKRKIILKARQFGVSTNEIIKMFDYVLFNRNVTACIIAHEQKGIKKLFRIVKRLHMFLEKTMPDLCPELDRGGGSQFEYYYPELNSRIYCDLESRGDTINYLHVSECAFMKDESKLNATLQAVPFDGGIITIETTLHTN